MINYVTGDATDPVTPRPFVVAHICNDQGRWGRGFVLAVAARWPVVEREYRRWASGCTDQPFILGEVQFVEAEPGVVVANIIGQHGVRSSPLQRPPIRYSAVEQGLAHVAAEAKRLGASVHMPRIGCGLAGGSWPLVEKIIVAELAGIATYVYTPPHS